MQADQRTTGDASRDGRGRVFVVDLAGSTDFDSQAWATVAADGALGSSPFLIEAHCFDDVTEAVACGKQNSTKSRVWSLFKIDGLPQWQTEMRLVWPIKDIVSSVGGL